MSLFWFGCQCNQQITARIWLLLVEYYETANWRAYHCYRFSGCTAWRYHRRPNSCHLSFSYSSPHDSQEKKLENHPGEWCRYGFGKITNPWPEQWMLVCALRPSTYGRKSIKKIIHFLQFRYAHSLKAYYSNIERVILGNAVTNCITGMMLTRPIHRQ